METLCQDSSASAAISLTGEKVCRGGCGETKHVTEFVIARTGRYKDGRKNICRSCQRAKNAEYAKRNPEYWTERGRVVKAQRIETDDTWKGLDAALSMFTSQKTTPLQRGV